MPPPHPGGPAHPPTRLGPLGVCAGPLDRTRTATLATTTTGETVYKPLTLAQIEDLPTLAEGQADNLKLERVYGDDDIYPRERVWISRCTVEDGEPFNHKITHEVYDGDRWVTAAEYPAPTPPEGETEASLCAFMAAAMLCAENDGRAYRNRAPEDAVMGAFEYFPTKYHLAIACQRALVACLAIRWRCFNV